jgi:hypothetical protein
MRNAKGPVCDGVGEVGDKYPVIAHDLQQWTAFTGLTVCKIRRLAGVSNL